MKNADEFIDHRLQERREAGNLRALRTETGMIDFCSNDYLGFARSRELARLTGIEMQQLSDHLNGSTGSRLISGNTAYTEQLEAEIAAFHQSSAGLLFNSGYDANIGLFSSLPQRGDTVITDELIHASVIDGCRLSNANRYTFKHNDPEALEQKLRNAKGNCYVAIESIYSMDGDIPPILEILKLTEQYGANLIVDEAHAVGLYKRGLITELGLQDRIFARVVTFGKALGCHGAIVLGGANLREYLVNFARSFIYTTAAPVHQLAAIRSAYQMLANADGQTRQLKVNIDLFRSSLSDQARTFLVNSESAIQCLIVSGNGRARALANHLQSNNLDVRAILSPTVAAGLERIRVCVHSYNSENDITLLTQVINLFFNA